QRDDSIMADRSRDAALRRYHAAPHRPIMPADEPRAPAPGPQNDRAVLSACNRIAAVRAQGPCDEGVVAAGGDFARAVAFGVPYKKPAAVGAENHEIERRAPCGAPELTLDALFVHGRAVGHANDAHPSLVVGDQQRLTVTAEHESRRLANANAD